MRLLRFLLLLPLAFAFAVPAAAFFLLLGGLMEPAGQSFVMGLVDAILGVFESALIDENDLATFTLPLAWSLWRASLAILVAPIVCIGLAGEAFRVTSFIFYAGGAGLVTALMPWIARARMGMNGGGQAGHPLAAEPGELRITALLFLTGVVAGTVYWLIAGRTAAAIGAAPAPPSLRQP